MYRNKHDMVAGGSMHTGSFFAHMFVRPWKVTYLSSFNQILISNPKSLWNNKNIHMRSSEILKTKQTNKQVFFGNTLLSSQRVQLLSRFFFRFLLSKWCWVWNNYLIKWSKIGYSALPYKHVQRKNRYTGWHLWPCRACFIRTYSKDKCPNTNSTSTQPKT